MTYAARVETGPTQTMVLPPPIDPNKKLTRAIAELYFKVTIGHITRTLVALLSTTLISAA